MCVQLNNVKNYTDPDMVDFEILICELSNNSDSNILFGWICVYCDEIKNFNFVSRKTNFMCEKCRGYFNLIGWGIYFNIDKYNIDNFLKNCIKNKTFLKIDSEYDLPDKFSKIVKKYITTNDLKLINIYTSYSSFYKDYDDSETLDILLKLIDKNNYDDMKRIVKERKFNLSYTKYSETSHTNILTYSIKTHNVLGIKLLHENNYDFSKIKNLALIIFSEYHTNPNKILNFIIYMVQNDIYVEKIYKKSIELNYYDVFLHLENICKYKINSIWFDDVFLLCGKKGLYLTVKKLFDLNHLTNRINNKLAIECLMKCIEVNTYCDISRYYLIYYLYVEKQIIPNKIIKRRIDYFLNNYNANNFVSLKYKNHLYLPDVFQNNNLDEYIIRELNCVEKFLNFIGF